VDSVLEGESKEVKDDIVESICGPASKLNVAEVDEKLLASLKAMRDNGDVDNTAAFRDLTRELKEMLNAKAKAAECSRERAPETGERANAGQARTPMTPPHLTHLLPNLTGTSLVLNPIKRFYRGFYPTPEGTKGSTQATWNGCRKNLEELEALTEVVDWLWKQHINAGGDPEDKPVPREMELAVLVAHGDREAAKELDGLQEVLEARRLRKKEEEKVAAIEAAAEAAAAEARETQKARAKAKAKGKAKSRAEAKTKAAATKEEKERAAAERALIAETKKFVQEQIKEEARKRKAEEKLAAREAKYRKI